MSQEYVAGSCNIGKSEIRRRQIVALAGALFSVFSLAGLINADAAQSARLTLFVPLFVFAIGFVQSRKKFCLAYGFMGTFNFGGLGKISRVSDPIAKREDRKTALKILLQSALIAFGLTLIVFVLPI
ncbi:unannotated protein [freshwater metagenome]|uniref:Unannotated protein n=1 Tax=freshwater metagenome TaxID=449393 RepID=A0A6J6HLZ3_9ZZZZ|nr:hypothetical protein [Actinomycetota bacterium]